MDGDARIAKPSPSRLRQRIALAVGGVLVVVTSAWSGGFLCALIESPIIAPQREIPALFVTVVGALWLAGAFAVWAVFALMSLVARLRPRARRRWLLIVVILTLVTWGIVVLKYATDPMTARRWALYFENQ